MKIELYHECRSNQNEGAIAPLDLSPHKTVYQPSIAEMGALGSTVTPNMMVPYFENWVCKYCNHRTLRKTK